MSRIYWAKSKNGYPLKVEPHQASRNVMCPFYDSCLSYSAWKYWPSFTCAGCPNERELEIDVDNPLSILALIFVVLYPVKNRNHQKVEQLFMEFIERAL